MKLPIISWPSRGNRGSAKNRSGHRRSPWPGRVGVLTVFLPQLVFFIASAVYLFHVYALLQSNLTPIVAAEVSRQLNREVRLKNLDLMPLGTVTLEEPRISDGPSFAHGTPTLARADRVTLHYSVMGLLFDPSNVSHSLGVVSLDNPVVRITRLPENGFNITDIFTHKPGPDHKPFLGTILVNNGEILFRDYRVPAAHLELPAITHIAGVNGSVDFSSPRHMLFTANGSATGVRRFSTAAVHGGASRLHSSQYAIFVHVNNGDLSYWSTYFKSFPQLRVTGGTGNADVQLVKTGQKSPLDLTGDIDYSNATVRLTNPYSKVVQAPFLGLTGIAHFNNASVQTHGTFSLNDQKIAASGILYDFNKPGPYVDFVATTSNANVNSLVEAIPPIKLPPVVTSAAASGQISFIGPLNSPVIDGNLKSPRVTFMGHDASNVAAHIHFYDKVFSASRVTCQFPHGGTGLADLTVNGSGTNSAVRADGSIKGYNLADLLQSGMVADTAQLRGRGDFDFIADNKTGPMILRSNMRSSDFSVRGIAELQGAGRITWPNGEEIHVDRFVARGPQGTLAATGEVPVQSNGQDWKLALDVSGVDLNLAARPFLAVPVQGLASFHGQLTGPSGAPDIAGRGEVFGGRYARYSVDSIVGKFNYSGNKLAMSKVLIRRYPTEATVSGTFTGLETSNPSVNASVHFARADLQDFSNLVQQFNQPHQKKRIKLSHHVEAQVQDALSTLTGTAQGDVNIAGYLDDPQVLGEAVVTDATVGAYRVDRARANFDYRHSLLQITRGLVSIEGSNITASGDYMVKTGHVDGTFAGSDVDLSKFRRITTPYADITGTDETGLLPGTARQPTIDFSGALSGTYKQPAVTVGVVTHNIVVNRQRLADLSAFARYDDGVIDLTGDPWVFTLARPKTYNSAAGQTTYRIDSFKLEIPTAAHLKRPVYLDLEADIPIDSPETVKHFIDTLQGSSLANTSAVQGIIDNYNRIPQPLSGELSADSIKVQGNLDALNVSTVGHIANLTVGENRAQSVDLTLNSSVHGIRLSDAVLTASHITIAGLPLDGLTAQGSMSGRTVTLENFSATGDRAYIEAQGNADLDGKIQGTLDASGIPLSLFNAYLPGSRALTGELSSLTVTASGPTKEPDLTASVTLDKPAITLKSAQDIMSPALSVQTAEVPSANRKKGARSGSKVHKPSVLAKQIPPQDSGQTYSLDRIRSGSITLISVGNTGERILTVTDLSAFKGGRPVATFSGSVPLRWNSDAALSINTLNAQPLTAQLKVLDLGALAALSPLVDPARTGGSLVATVTPNSSTGGMTGNVVLTNGSIGFLGVNTSLRKIEGSAAFNASGFKIDSFTADSNTSGTVSLSGSGTLGNNPQLDLTLATNKFAVNESGNQTLLAKYYGSSFGGKVNGAIKITGSPWSPVIANLPTAPVVVTDVKGTIPAPTQTAETEPATYPIDPSFDSVTATIGVPDKPAEVSNALIQAYTIGSATIKGKLSAPTLDALFTIYRGTVLIPPSTRMKFVKHSTIRLKYPVPTTDEAGDLQQGMSMQVELYAQATVFVRRSTLAAYQSVGQGTTTAIGSQPLEAPVLQATGIDAPVRYTIDATISGDLNDPNPNNKSIVLTSNPGDLSQTQMYAALGGYSGLLGPNGLTDQFNNLVAGVILPGILRPIENSVATGLGLSDFSFDYSNNSSPSVTLTKALTNRIDVIYIQSFGDPGTGLSSTTNVLPLYTVKLSYSLTNRLQLSYSTDDQHDNIVALEGVYAF